jgi:hypothetical protein
MYQVLLVLLLAFHVGVMILVVDGILVGTVVEVFLPFFRKFFIAFHPNCCNSGSLRMSYIAGQIP